MEMMKNELVIIALIGVGGILAYKIIDQHGANLWERRPKTSYPAPQQTIPSLSETTTEPAQVEPTPACCDTCCVSPCICPVKKEKCIDCVCYTPQYYDLECACGFFADAEFLYWYARETNTAYAAVVTTQEFGVVTQDGDSINLAPIRETKRLKAEWDPGVRIGVGWNGECDGWDLYLNWTYFKNTSHRKASEPGTDLFQVGQSGLISPWILPTSSTGLSFYNSISASWGLRFNQIDLELGRKYWLSPCFTLRPYLGLRGAWTDTQFSVKGSALPHSVGLGDSLETISYTDSVRYRNQLWGVGILAGIQPSWYICSNFFLYGNLDAALLWGQHKSKKKEVFQGTGQDLISSFPLQLGYRISTPNDAFYQLSTLLDIGIGLGWEERWCCERYQTTLELGWEHHAWNNHSHRYKEFLTPNQTLLSDTRVALGLTNDFVEEIADLGFGGLVVRLRLDF